MYVLYIGTKMGDGCRQMLFLVFNSRKAFGEFIGSLFQFWEQIFPFWTRALFFLSFPYQNFSHHSICVSFWFCLVLTCQNLSKHVQTCPNLPKLAQTCPDLPKLAQNYPKLPKIVQNSFSPILSFLWIKKGLACLTLALVISLSQCTGACWEFVLESIKLPFILSGVCSWSEVNYCSNPFEVFLL